MTTKLHSLFSFMTRYNWRTINNINFNNGLYIIFENGEKYNKTDRIVRVGTHNSDGRLKARLKNHFINENKDGSILRKNIGKAILSRSHDIYLGIWSKNSSNKSKMENVPGYDSDYQKLIETLVSKYMRENMSFSCFSVSTEVERLRLEEGIIATLNKNKDFYASVDWLGNYSPEEKIRQSGMWLKQGLNKEPLSETEIKQIEMYCSATEIPLFK